MGELLFIIALVGILLVIAIWMWLRDMKLFSGYVIYVGVGLGVFELVAKILTGDTLSQRFWKFSLANPIEGFVLSALLVVWITIVAVHLYWKNLKGKKK